jgi:uncharacterized protein YjaZ
MNDYKVTVVFTVKALDDTQAREIVKHEIQENVRFKGVPYAENDSGIVNFGVIQLNDEVYIPNARIIL